MVFRFAVGGEMSHLHSVEILARRLAEQWQMAHEQGGDGVKYTFVYTHRAAEVSQLVCREMGHVRTLHQRSRRGVLHSAHLKSLMCTCTSGGVCNSQTQNSVTFFTSLEQMCESMDRTLARYGDSSLDRSKIISQSAVVVEEHPGCTTRAHLVVNEFQNQQLRARHAPHRAYNRKSATPFQTFLKELDDVDDSVHCSKEQEEGSESEKTRAKRQMALTLSDIERVVRSIRSTHKNNTPPVMMRKRKRPETMTMATYAMEEDDDKGRVQEEEEEEEDPDETENPYRDLRSEALVTERELQLARLKRYENLGLNVGSGKTLYLLYGEKDDVERGLIRPRTDKEIDTYRKRMKKERSQLK